jgi:hypothetical protein
MFCENIFRICSFHNASVSVLNSQWSPGLTFKRVLFPVCHFTLLTPRNSAKETPLMAFDELWIWNGQLYFFWLCTVHSCSLIPSCEKNNVACVKKKSCWHLHLIGTNIITVCHWLTYLVSILVWHSPWPTNNHFKVFSKIDWAEFNFNQLEELLHSVTSRI